MRFASLLLDRLENPVHMFATRNKKLLGAPGIATRSKDATRGSWHCY